jgi:serine/threonine-protein kinase
MKRTTQTAARLGTVLDGRYLIISQIGEGAFGVVYRARELETGQDVAIKTLRTAAAQVQELVARIAREVEICAQLSHPNTARLLNYGLMLRPDLGFEVPYLVFELVQGLPLGEVLVARGKLRLEEAVHVLAETLDSLHEAHLSGILHRDLKPNNVLIEAPEALRTTPAEEGPPHARLGIPAPSDAAWADVTSLGVKVVDFGLGKILLPSGSQSGQHRLTADGTMAGTAHYMAPEQAQGAKDIDFRADVYGVTMLLYQLLTGTLPYDGGGPVAVAMRHINEPLPPLGPPYDGQPIAEVYLRGGAKRREDRFASAAEMAWALRCCVEPALARGSQPPFKRPRRDTGKRVSLGLFSKLFRRGGDES